MSDDDKAQRRRTIAGRLQARRRDQRRMEELTRHVLDAEECKRRGMWDRVAELEDAVQRDVRALETERMVTRWAS